MPRVPEAVLEKRRKWREKMRKWRAKDPERKRNLMRMTQNKWRAKNKIHVRKTGRFNMRKWRAANYEYVRAQGRKYYAANSEQIKIRSRKNYAEKKHHYRATSAKWRAKNPDKMKQYRLNWKRQWQKRFPSTTAYNRWSNYGIQHEDYSVMLKQQKGCCAICLKKFGTKLKVDHCHRSNTLRALLCDLCNAGLGLMRDDPKRLRAAADYVELFEETR